MPMFIFVRNKKLEPLFKVPTGCMGLYCPAEAYRIQLFIIQAFEFYSVKVKIKSKLVEKNKDNIVPIYIYNPCTYLVDL